MLLCAATRRMNFANVLCSGCKRKGGEELGQSIGLDVVASSQGNGCPKKTVKQVC